MKPYTKMMLMTYGQKSGEDRENEYRKSPRNEHDDGRMEYGAESRFRDRRGRERYDNGRYAPMRNEMRREYEEMDDEDDMGGEFEPYRPFIPPYGEGDRMNEIGFERGMNANYESMDEMKSRRSEKEHGYAMADESFNHETAKEWTKSMHNEDGTKGPHWTMEQVKQVMAQRGIKHDPAVFWAILNSMYSDYCAVFKKHGVNNMDFYVDMTSAWINDKDAVKDKAGAYFEYVVKH